MRIKEIVASNKNGNQVTINTSSHYRLIKDLTTSGLLADVTYVSNFRTNGAKAVSTQLRQREFSMEFILLIDGKSQEWIQEKREELFKVFNPLLNPIRLVAKSDTKTVYIDCNVEITPSFLVGRDNSNRVWQKVIVQFSTESPFFSSIENKRYEIAKWLPSFEFPLEIIEEGIEMGYRSPSLIVNVFNDGHVETGMIIRFKALGTVVNPSLFNVNTREWIKINKEMTGGEVITINTLHV